jgi:LysR family transcriptional regulator, benzoate and cis,cis-muconate-responsive activator of ben and cat genes
MELRHLRYFVAVADEQHVGRAAARLHISPSPLSRQLHELEQELGTPLLERVGRGIRTTPAGTAFAINARAILADADRAVSKVQATARGETGHLAIGFVESGVLAELIPAIVATFRREHPNVTLELQPLTNDDLRLALRARKITAALSFGLAEPEPAMRAQLLFAKRIALALPESHPLAARQRLFVRDLQNQAFVWSARPERAPYLDAMWVQIRAQGVTPNVVVECRSTTTRLSLVASGVGLTFIADSGSPPAHVRVKWVADLKVEAKAYLAWHPDGEPSPLLRSLLDITRAQTRTDPRR